MTALLRLRPDPIPAIHPLAEYAVEGRRAAWYGEMKTALQVPWMGVVTMAYAHYPNFFAELWRGLKPLAGSRPFVEQALALREMIERDVAALAPPPILTRLADAGYGEREVAGIRDINAVFSHGNHFYALFATIVRLLLEGGKFGVEAAAPPFDGRHAPVVEAPLVLMEAHHADAPTRANYDDIKSVLNLPFVNTDYRAFARWPSYWAIAWSDLREVAGQPPHERLCQAYHDQLLRAALEILPNPGDLRGAALRDAAAADAPLDEVIAVARLFQWLLPGLGTNVAYLKSQLAASSAA